MAWNTQIDYTGATILSAGLINGVGSDLRRWGGNVNGGGYVLSNVVVIPLGTTSSYAQAFSAVTGVTVTGTQHGLATSGIVAAAYDASGNQITIVSTNVNPSTFAVTVTFGSSNTGTLVLLGPGNISTPSYTGSFSTVASISISGATHALGTAALVVTVYDASGNELTPAAVNVDPVTFNVTVTLGAAASGTVYLFSGAGSTSSTVAPAIMVQSVTSKGRIQCGTGANGQLFLSGAVTAPYIGFGIVSNKFTIGDTNNGTYLCVDPTTSRVGVLTSSPAFTLDVAGAINGQGFMRLAPTTPASAGTPTSNTDGRWVVTPGGNLCFIYNDGGTVRYLFAPLNTTSATWTKSTSAPS